MSEKTLLKIVRNFDAHYEDELSVTTGQTVQFLSKIDRMWFKVYADGHEGKIPINTCQEWSPSEMDKLSYEPDNGQSAFVAKFDFIADAQEGDLKFSNNELLIGLYLTNENWWYGTRLNSVIWKENRYIVKPENCGIFPITHTWMLRTDLLPDSVFRSSVILESVDEHLPSTSGTFPIEVEEEMSYPNLDSSMGKEPKDKVLHSNPKVSFSPPIDSDNHDDKDNRNKSPEGMMFRVKVMKTMKAQLAEEMDLLQVGDILAVLSEPDRHYYYGSTLDGSRKGIFPKSFVQMLASSNGSSGKSTPEVETLPPIMSPPPLPSTVGELLSVPTTSRMDLEDPPSYEVAIQESPIYVGYSNQMLEEIESYGQVLYDFVAQQESELSVRANQIVRLIRHFDHEWLECEKDTKIGFIPKSYVKIIVDCERSSSSNNEKNENSMDSNSSANLEVEYPEDSFAEAIEDFHPQFEHDLAMSTGDRLKLLKHFTNTDWVQAQDNFGRIGLVPLTFLKGIEREETPEPIPIKSVVSEKSRIDSHSDIPDSVLSKSPQNPSKSHRSAPQIPRVPAQSLPYPTLNQFRESEKLSPQPSSPEPSSSHSTTVTVPFPSVSETKAPLNRASMTVAQRQCIITELIQTEKDYAASLDVFVKVITHLDEIERPVGFDVQRVTEEMEVVVKVSGGLSKLLDNYARDKAACDQRVGICFLNSGREIHDAYMKYCRSHDDLKQLIQTYQSQRELGQFLQRCEKRIQEKTNCFDLYSVIIKPIQRILKYPLLLSELIGCTDDNHIDKKELQSALEQITKTASDINELKRRQDLVEKYCKQAHEGTFVDKLGSLNRHSLLKKVGRVKNRVLSKIFTPMFEDKEYDDIVYKFRHLQSSVQEFVNKLNAYLSHVKDYSLHVLYVSNAFLEYLGRRKSDIEFWRDAHQEVRKCFEEFNTNMNKYCVEVLKKLVYKFRNPNILIDKREDKKLDYEQSLKSRPPMADNSKSTDMSETHFQALNIQLKEELPLLTDLSLDIFTFAIKSLIVCHRKLHTKNASIFLRLHDELPELKSIPTDYYQNIEEDFRIKHNILYEQMFQDFSILRISDSSSEKHFRRNSKWVEPIRVKPASPQIGAKFNDDISQNDDQKRELRRLYKDKDIFVVINSYRADNVAELSVEVGDIVGVVKYKDPMGRDLSYFVDKGNKQKGFIPKSILKPYDRHLFETQCSTSSSERFDTPEQGHCYDQVPNEDGPESLLSFDETLTAKNGQSQSIISQFDPLNSKNQQGTSKSNSSSSSNLKSLVPPRPEVETYVAAFDFKAADRNQLSVLRGQSVRIREKCDMNGNSEWWLVENLMKERGYVPANYLAKQ